VEGAHENTAWHTDKYEHYGLVSSDCIQSG
jgi:hypothetical protein